MTTINAYLTFCGNCRDAMLFYKDCLGGELSIQTVEESPMADQWPIDTQKHILHAALVKGDMVLLASDINSVPLINGNTISLSLNCADETEINNYFVRLSQGGIITHPLHDFFGGKIGALTDKHGISWLLYLEKK